MSVERPRLHTAIEQVLQPLTGELTLDGLHIRVQEALGRLLTFAELWAALEILVAGKVIAETRTGNRCSYRWLGYGHAGAQPPSFTQFLSEVLENARRAEAPPSPPPAAPAPQQEPPVAKEKPTRRQGEARERIRAIWNKDRNQTAKDIAPKVDMTPDAVAYHLAILRKEANGEGTADAFVRAKRAQASPAQKKRAKEAPLDAELQRISARFAPIVHLPEKIAVLDQLASGISGKVGALLVEIREDLVRVGA